MKSRELTVRQRVRLTIVSGLAFVVTTACSLLRAGRTWIQPTCYEPLPVTEEPTVIVECYEAVIEESPTPSPMCYTLTVSPLESPLSTPTATPKPESRGELRDRLLAQGRFPAAVSSELTKQ
ncbi:MAG: hypothetical protein ACLFU8_17370 [Anaerolineales bacterium]